MIAASVILIWTGTNASIPAGWVRAPELDSRFPKGASAGIDPNVTGGAPTHTHTSPAHSHAMNSHVHVIQIASALGGTPATASATGITAEYHHGHAPFNSGGVSGSYTVSSVAVTYAAYSNDPPYYEVIYIKKSAGWGGIPNGVVGLCDDSAFVNDTDKWRNFYQCDGNNSTPNLTDKYLKGATASGDSGGTGGALTNAHSIDHAHTQSHAHDGATSGPALTSRQDAGGSGYVLASHTHSITLPANTTATGTTSIPLSQSETVEPAYKKLMAIQNRAGTTITPPKGIIGMWVGALSTIPVGWLLCDGNNGTIDMRDKYLKITNTPAHIGNTGGANSHTHAAQSHGHGNIAHNHINSTPITHTGAIGRADPDGQAEPSNATHAGSTQSDVNYVLANSNTTADSASNEPQYLTVAFIKLNLSLQVSSFLGLFVDNIK